MALEDALNEHARRPGDFIGTLQWHSRSGKVRRWTILRGSRVNQIRVKGCRGDKSWSWLLARLRARISRGV